MIEFLIEWIIHGVQTYSFNFFTEESSSVASMILKKYSRNVCSFEVSRKKIKRVVIMS